MSEIKYCKNLQSFSVKFENNVRQHLVQNCLGNYVIAFAISKRKRQKKNPHFYYGGTQETNVYFHKCLNFFCNSVLIKRFLSP